ncbi:MAG TPA: hypothetical protein VGS21_01295, partial [Acidimicrobiales bacterium]|nr:hypothetical protein [Acidimicrobiales bacterium]
MEDEVVDVVDVAGVEDVVEDGVVEVVGVVVVVDEAGAVVVVVTTTSNVMLPAPAREAPASAVMTPTAISKGTAHRTSRRADLMLPATGASRVSTPRARAWSSLPGGGGGASREHLLQSRPTPPPTCPR